MPKTNIKIRVATKNDHKEICGIAKQSKYTNAYSNMIFSGDGCYAQGRIRVATVGNKIVGFTCFRNRKRNPATVLYFVGVDKAKQRLGVGKRLLSDLQKVSIGIIEFKVATDNHLAKGFYDQLGFEVQYATEDNKYWVMRNENKNAS
jgi:ribosomal protein S18 acetylase RimI-like enzyme